MVDFSTVLCGLSLCGSWYPRIPKRAFAFRFALELLSLCTCALFSASFQVNPSAFKHVLMWYLVSENATHCLGIKPTLDLIVFGFNKLLFFFGCQGCHFHFCLLLLRSWHQKGELFRMVIISPSINVHKIYVDLQFPGLGLIFCESIRFAKEIIVSMVRGRDVFWSFWIPYFLKRRLWNGWCIFFFGFWN